MPGMLEGQRNQSLILSEISVRLILRFFVGSCLAAAKLGARNLSFRLLQARERQSSCIRRAAYIGIKKREKFGKFKKI